MDQTKIGLFIRELRKEKDLTQEQLAEKTCSDPFHCCFTSLL